jgi:hypothetical protein
MADGQGAKVIWFRPPNQSAARKWFESPVMDATIFQGLATIVFAKRLLMPAMKQIPANDRDHVKW